jgi:endonuclease-3
VSSRSSGSLAAGPVGDRLPLLVARLERSYGPFSHARRGDPLDSLIGTVLSQNTTDVNSGRAFARLKQRFPTWQAVLAARPRDIARAIRSGGLGDIKSRRIKRILRRIAEDRGKADLSFLRRTPPELALKYLRDLPGVGPKTAACVLLFSLGKPAFPVDTHVLRVSKRLGILPPNATMERAHDIYAQLLDSDEPGRPAWDAKAMLALHLSLVRHGRQVCSARRPRCDACSLFELCPRIGVAGAPRQPGGTR